jgi:aryl-alcohol dehydrogenase-like predicted oxidoreductase
MRQRTLADGTTVSALALGAMFFGTTVDEATSFAILDRFVEAGGTLIDTADNYAFWVDGGAGGESEALLGRWLASRGVRDQVVLSTKVGAQPTVPGTTWSETGEGLSAGAIRSAVEGSLKRLGTDHTDVYWAHVEDRSVPLDETLGAFSALVDEGTTRVLGVSNHATWLVERARALARARSWPAYSCLQYRYSYLRPRTDIPLGGGHTHAGDELLDYVRTEPDLTLWVYTALLSGAYTRTDKPLAAPYDHPGTANRLTALREVAADVGATPNQVVLSWLMGGDPPMLPIVGVSSVAQLDEVLAATDVTLDEEHRRRLDEAG